MPFSLIDWQPPDTSSTTAASSLLIVGNMEVFPVSSFFIVLSLLSLAAAGLGSARNSPIQYLRHVNPPEP
jgi:hypothetical protein